MNRRKLRDENVRLEAENVKLRRHIDQLEASTVLLQEELDALINDVDELLLNPSPGEDKQMADEIKAESDRLAALEKSPQ